MAQWMNTSIWAVSQSEAKTLPLDQQVMYIKLTNTNVAYKYVRFFIINITFCDFSEISEIFKSKLFKISQSAL